MRVVGRKARVRSPSNLSPVSCTIQHVDLQRVCSNAEVLHTSCRVTLNPMLRLIGPIFTLSGLSTALFDREPIISVGGLAVED